MDMNMGDMMKKVQEMTGRMQQMDEEMKKKVVEGQAGGGMVTAKVNGVGDLIGLELDKSVIDPEDPEMLADLIIAAVGAAKQQTKGIREQGLREMTGGIDLGAMGINIPGL